MAFLINASVIKTQHELGWIIPPLLIQGLDAGQYIFTVNATDADDGLNRDLVYTFEGGATRKDPFRINMNTGDITTTEVLDREEDDIYEVCNYEFTRSSTMFQLVAKHL